ncbi:hypothetical protein [Paenibacillus glucanolyticus]|uniref:hypothetical protein n=1 Tax=Paenibacillus glucanolyticus TaxID=59843 RepID=UPI0030D1C44A
MINLNENELAVELDYTYGFGIPIDLIKDMEEYEYIMLKGILSYEDFLIAADQIEALKEPVSDEIDCSQWYVDPEAGFALKIDYEKPKLNDF